MSKVKDKLFTVLRNRPQVITRAAFWKIPHNTREDEVTLKVGRYKKPKDWYENEEPESLTPKSELTFDNEEFVNLINIEVCYWFMDTALEKR